MTHTSPSPFAGRIVRLKDTLVHRQYPDIGGSAFVIEDWWDRLTGKSWLQSANEGNPGAVVYALRIGAIEGVEDDNPQVPHDNEVLAGHLQGGVFKMGCLVHLSEIEL